MTDTTEQSLFSYTSGRFLYNESIRLRERYVEFNVAALKEAVSQHTGHGKVVSLQKLSEGGFNRVFLAKLEDNSQVIVKIPFDHSVPKTYATASEAATLKFLRSKGVPAPKVYGWSSMANNPVGAEYIVMELAPGIGLDSKWFELTKKQQLSVATDVVDIEQKLFAIPFSSIGSIYFKKDLPSHLQSDLYLPGTADPDGDSEQFCIGPTSDYMFWHGKRAEMGLDCGPWKSPHEYLLAIGKRELAWAKKFGEPRGVDFPHNAFFPDVNSHELYIALLEKYLAIAPFLLPRELSDPGNQAVLRHPDLTPSNVFVSPETYKITSIIDWQHTVTSPLLLAAGHPRLFENPDAETPESLEPPEPPEGYAALDAAEKAEVDDLLRRRHLYYLYRVFNGARNKQHLSACADPVLLPRQHLVDYAGRQWMGNLMTLRGALIRMREFWPLLPTDKECPISFTEEEVEKHREDEAMWFNLNLLLNNWRDKMGGVSEEGWVRTEAYDLAVEKNKELKAQCIKEADPDEVDSIKLGWPFRDREEFF
ncbi:Phosphotransferase enzyme [Arachnomyces sp. PD_36]|nr:Phosphotransferase enzyme [Arachnomyces sp. PD_36]